MAEPETTAEDILRGDILAMGCDDSISMADVQGQISCGQLADSTTERQRLVVGAVRPLLEDGLVEIGDTQGEAALVQTMAWKRKRADDDEKT